MMIRKTFECFVDGDVPSVNRKFIKGFVLAPEYRAWRDWVGIQTEAMLRRKGIFRFPYFPAGSFLSVHLIFYVRNKIWNIDNAIKPTLDGMNKVVYHDDRDVWVLDRVAKKISKEKKGVFVIVQEIEKDETDV